jgi:antitoxin component HigA of HigAB toxin-antitoxin module
MGLSLRISSARKDIEAQVDEELSRLVTELTNEITVHLREHGLTRAELAGRMGVSPGRISQVLSGGENLTLRTLAALSTALDAQFDVQLRSCKPAADAGFGPLMADLDEATSPRE